MRQYSKACLTFIIEIAALIKTPAKTEIGINSITCGKKYTTIKINIEWKIAARRVLAPLSMLIFERASSCVIGIPPKIATAQLAKP